MEKNQIEALRCYSGNVVDPECFILDPTPRSRLDKVIIKYIVAAEKIPKGCMYEKIISDEFYHF